MNLRSGKFVTVTSINGGEHSISWRYIAGGTIPSNEFVRDNFLGHGHPPPLCRDVGQLDFARLQFLGKRQDATILKNQSSHRVVSLSKFGEGN